MPDFDNMIELNIVILIFDVAITAYLLLGSMLSRKNFKEYMKYYIKLLVCNLFLQTSAALLWAVEGHAENVLLIKCIAVNTNVLQCIEITLYYYCVSSLAKRNGPISWRIPQTAMVLNIVAAAVFTVSACVGQMLEVDKNSIIMYGEAYGVFECYINVMLAGLIVLMIRYRKPIMPRKTWGLSSFVILLVLIFLIEPIWHLTPMYMVITLSLVGMYVLIHVGKSDALARKEVELMENQITLMLSQIQPHFLYNSLTAAASLCDSNPQMAKKAILEFSKYLRGNVDSLAQNTPILFSKELQHIKAYLQLEKLRFEDKLEVIYDIEVESFLIPSLTVQPLVENAVKHGIQKKEGAGCVVIRTWEEETSYVIEVSDDGCGFEQLSEDDGKIHVGIKNVRTRLWSMSKAVLDIHSEVGNGTVAIITIPKE